jgi:hypothetical protein
MQSVLLEVASAASDAAATDNINVFNQFLLKHGIVEEAFDWGVVDTYSVKWWALFIIDQIQEVSFKGLRAFYAPSRRFLCALVWCFSLLFCLHSRHTAHTLIFSLCLTTTNDYIIGSISYLY